MQVSLGVASYPTSNTDYPAQRSVWLSSVDGTNQRRSIDAIEESSRRSTEQVDGLIEWNSLRSIEEEEEERCVDSSGEPEGSQVARSERGC